MKKVTVLATYKLSPSNLQRIKNLSSSVDVSYAQNKGEIEKHLPYADVLFGELDSKMLSVAIKLKWVHLAFAGADKALFPELVASDVMLTSSKGLHKQQMTELLFGMMLTLTRQLRRFGDFQAKKKWDISPFRETEVLAGKTIGILGLGSIGSEIARVAKGFNMKVIGLRKHISVPVEKVDVVIGPDKLSDLLEESDHIVIALPLTAETRNLITGSEFDQMRQVPYFFNLARGAIVREADLIEALKLRKIKGAGLDVFSDEPLDKSSPLWKMENVIIIPHIGGLIPHYMRSAVTLFLDNLGRFCEGKELLNVVDKREGY